MLNTSNLFSPTVHTYIPSEVISLFKYSTSRSIFLIYAPASTPFLVPDVIPVYCTATLDNCPDEVLSQEYGQSLRRFIHSEQHLKENVVSSDITHMSTRSLRNNKFVHTVSIIMHVRTARLWESPSKYIRKHLSLENYWTRSNGTIVRLSRIHQKD